MNIEAIWRQYSREYCGSLESTHCRKQNVQSSRDFALQFMLIEGQNPREYWGNIHVNIEALLPRYSREYRGNIHVNIEVIFTLMLR